MTGEPSVSATARVALIPLTPLGDADAVVCEGDVCYIPGAADAPAE